VGGGSQHDVADYSVGATARVIVNQHASISQGGLAPDRARDSFGGLDTITGVRDVIGTQFNDQLWGGGHDNVMLAGAGNDFVFGHNANDTINGGIGNDILDGGAHNDLIDGSVGNDTLLGGIGNDTLIGGVGIDRLTGGLGRDVMTGGTLRDIFDFNAVAETGRTATTRDVIRDFVHLTDDIDLATIDANGAAAGNAAFKFLAAKGAAFTGVQGQLHWFQQNAAGTVNDKTIVEGDINGDRRADFAIELTGLKTLTVHDFIL
jgi:Ca2+-binding RTX toxin-like protein